MAKAAGSLGDAKQTEGGSASERRQLPSKPVTKTRIGREFSISPDTLQELTLTAKMIDTLLANTGTEIDLNPKESEMATLVGSENIEAADIRSRELLDALPSSSDNTAVSHLRDNLQYFQDQIHDIQDGGESSSDPKKAAGQEPYESDVDAISDTSGHGALRPLTRRITVTSFGDGPGPEPYSRPKVTSPIRIGEEGGEVDMGGPAAEAPKDYKAELKALQIQFKEADKKSGVVGMARGMARLVRSKSPVSLAARIPKGLNGLIDAYEQPGFELSAQRVDLLLDKVLSSPTPLTRHQLHRLEAIFLRGATHYREKAEHKRESSPPEARRHLTPPDGSESPRTEVKATLCNNLAKVCREMKESIHTELMNQLASEFGAPEVDGIIADVILVVERSHTDYALRELAEKIDNLIKWLNKWSREPGFEFIHNASRGASKALGPVKKVLSNPRKFNPQQLVDALQGALIPLTDISDRMMPDNLPLPEVDDKRRPLLPQQFGPKLPLQAREIGKDTHKTAKRLRQEIDQAAPDEDTSSLESELQELKPQENAMKLLMKVCTHFPEALQRTQVLQHGESSEA